MLGSAVQLACRFHHPCTEISEGYAAIETALDFVFDICAAEKRHIVTITCLINARCGAVSARFFLAVAAAADVRRVHTYSIII